MRTYNLHIPHLPRTYLELIKLLVHVSESISV